MNYNFTDLVLEGYANPATREFLTDYFIRKFKEAERDNFFTAKEFFGNCFSIIEWLENASTKLFLKRFHELNDLLNAAKQGILPIDEFWMRQTKETPEQYFESLAIDYENELKEILKKEFPVPLGGVTNGKFNGSLYPDEIKFIKSAILRAQNMIIIPEPAPKTQPEQQAPIIKPIFKPEAIPTILDLLKGFFSPEHQTQLKQILETGNNANEKLLFKDNANRLLDTFKKLIEYDFITGCQKQGLQEWIIQNFTFLKQGKVSSFKPETVEKGISRNTSPCKSPFIEIKNGQIIKAEQPRQKQYNNY